MRHAASSLLTLLLEVGAGGGEGGVQAVGQGIPLGQQALGALVAEEGVGAAGLRHRQNLHWNLQPVLGERPVRRVTRKRSVTNREQHHRKCVKCQEKESALESAVLGEAPVSRVTRNMSSP